MGTKFTNQVEVAIEAAVSSIFSTRSIGNSILRAPEGSSKVSKLGKSAMYGCCAFLSGTVAPYEEYIRTNLVGEDHKELIDWWLSMLTKMYGYQFEDVNDPKAVREVATNMVTNGGTNFALYTQITNINKDKFSKFLNTIFKKAEEFYPILFEVWKDTFLEALKRNPNFGVLGISAIGPTGAYSPVDKSSTSTLGNMNVIPRDEALEIIKNLKCKGVYTYPPNNPTYFHHMITSVTNSREFMLKISGNTVSTLEKKKMLISVLGLTVGLYGGGLFHGDSRVLFTNGKVTRKANRDIMERIVLENKGPRNCPNTVLRFFPYNSSSIYGNSRMLSTNVQNGDPFFSNFPIIPQSKDPFFYGYGVSDDLAEAGYSKIIEEAIMEFIGDGIDLHDMRIVKVNKGIAPNNLIPHTLIRSLWECPKFIRFFRELLKDYPTVDPYTLMALAYKTYGTSNYGNMIDSLLNIYTCIEEDPEKYITKRIYNRDTELGPTSLKVYDFYNMFINGNGLFSSSTGRTLISHESRSETSVRTALDKFLKKQNA